MNSGIYKITNLINNKIYVGHTSNFDSRFYFHKYELNKKIHGNEHLQNAWNKYGEDYFKFEVIEECIIDTLCEREDYWCSILNVHNRKYGYNIRLTDRNLKHGSLSTETKNKISISNKGRGGRKPGYKHSEETKKKVSDKLKGRKTGKRRVNYVPSAETRLKLSKSLTGKKRSEEAIRITTEKLRGRKKGPNSKISDVLSKVIYQYDNADNLIITFKGTGQAADSLKVSKSTICNRIRTGRLIDGIKLSYVKLF